MIFFTASLLGVATVTGLGSAGIPPEAHAVIRRVHAAATTKDFSVLRALMVKEFTWSFGGDGDADQAIEAWKGDVSTVRQLVRVTGRRCSFHGSNERIQCPPKAGYGYRAGFMKTEQGWRMSYFVAGD